MRAPTTLSPAHAPSPMKRTLHKRIPHLLFVALAAAQLAACGSSGHGNPFVLCGNGVIDPGEICDNGGFCSPGDVIHCTSAAECGEDAECIVRDNAACLSTCVPNECGDGFVNVGVEQCDGLNLDSTNGNISAPDTCGDLGLGEGTLSCDPECRFDTTQCGAPFTPTRTRTSTPTGRVAATATPTPTPTATPPPNCGNGTEEEGETCDDGNLNDDDDCPSDCQILPCTPSGTTQMVQVNFMSPPFQDADSIRVLVTYPDGVVSLPGMSNDASVDERITMRQSSTTVTPNDLDHALRVVYSRADGVDNGKIFAITFDECEGATPAPIDAFGCRVTGCSNANAGDIDGCTCVVVAPEQ